jgi:hypothetical protein
MTPKLEHFGESLCVGMSAAERCGPPSHPWYGVKQGVNDPQRTAARPKSCTAQVLTWSALSGMLRAFRVAAT